MLAFPGMLAPYAESAGIKVPENLEKYEPHDYPHWHVYLNIQLGASMPSPDAPSNNAKIIASLDEKRIKTVSFRDLEELGLSIGQPIP